MLVYIWSDPSNFGTICTDLRLKQRNISNIGKPFKSKFKLRLNIAQTGVTMDYGMAELWRRIVT